MQRVDNPFFSQPEQMVLCKVTGLTPLQVKNFFQNTRDRRMNIIKKYAEEYSRTKQMLPTPIKWPVQHETTPPVHKLTIKEARKNTLAAREQLKQKKQDDKALKKSGKQAADVDQAQGEAEAGHDDGGEHDDPQPQPVLQSKPVVIALPKPVEVELPKPVEVELPKHVIVELPKPVIVQSKPMPMPKPKAAAELEPTSDVLMSAKRVSRKTKKVQQDLDTVSEFCIKTPLNIKARGINKELTNLMDADGVVLGDRRRTPKTNKRDVTCDDYNKEPAHHDDDDGGESKPHPQPQQPIASTVVQMSPGAVMVSNKSVKSPHDHLLGQPQLTHKDGFIQAKYAAYDESMVIDPVTDPRQFLKRNARQNQSLPVPSQSQSKPKVPHVVFDLKDFVDSDPEQVGLMTLVPDAKTSLRTEALNELNDKAIVSPPPPCQKPDPRYAPARPDPVDDDDDDESLFPMIFNFDYGEKYLRERFDGQHIGDFDVGQVLEMIPGRIDMDERRVSPLIGKDRVMICPPSVPAYTNNLMSIHARLFPNKMNSGSFGIL